VQSNQWRFEEKPAKSTENEEETRRFTKNQWWNNEENL